MLRVKPYCTRSYPDAADSGGKDLLRNVYAGDNSTVGEQIPGISYQHIGWNVYVIPVLNTNINELECAPVRAGDENEKGEISVENKKAFIFYHESRVGHSNVRPPGDEIKIVHERFDAAG